MRQGRFLQNWKITSIDRGLSPLAAIICPLASVMFRQPAGPHKTDRPASPRCRIMCSNRAIGSAMLGDGASNRPPAISDWHGHGWLSEILDVVYVTIRLRLAVRLIRQPRLAKFAIRHGQFAVGTDSISFFSATRNQYGIFFTSLG